MPRRPPEPPSGRTAPRRPPAKKAAPATKPASKPTASRSKAAPKRAAAPAKPAAAKRSTTSTTRVAATRAPAKRSSTGPASRSASRSSERRALGRVDGPRGRRDGNPKEGRRASVRTRHRVGGVAVSVVLLIGVLFVAGFPLSSYLHLRSSTSKATAQLERVRAERKAIDAQRKKASTPAAIEATARDKFGYVKPGEQAYNILPAPGAAIGLPTGWPFTGVEQVLGGR